MRRELLPQQQRQLCAPTRASSRSSSRCDRSVRRRDLQLQPTSARYLLRPRWDRAIAVTGGPPTCRGGSRTRQPNAGKRVMHRGLLPQQQRQLCAPTRASSRSSSRCDRSVRRRDLQLQPTSARYLLRPRRCRAMGVSVRSFPTSSLGSIDHAYVSRYRPVPFLQWRPTA